MINTQFELTEADLSASAERESAAALRLNTKMAGLVNRFASTLSNNVEEQVNNRPPQKQPKITPVMILPMSFGEINVKVFELFGGQSHYRAFVEGHGMEVFLTIGENSQTFNLRTKLIGSEYVAINHNGQPIDEDTSYYYESILDIMEAITQEIV